MNTGQDGDMKNYTSVALGIDNMAINAQQVSQISLASGNKSVSSYLNH